LLINMIKGITSKRYFVNLLKKIIISHLPPPYVTHQQHRANDIVVN
jgi:hypothetical protein